MRVNAGSDVDADEPFTPAKVNGHRPSIVTLRRSTEVEYPSSVAYLVKGLIHPGDLSVWYGPSGCGKTFLALNAAHAVSTGRTVFGRRTRSAPVALFALEGSAGLAKRIKAVESEFGPAPDLYVSSSPLTLFKSQAIVQCVIEETALIGAKLIIFDTLSRTMAGANENAPEDMTLMVAAFDQIRKQTSAHVLLIHHTGKDVSLGARGHSSLRAAVDVEVEVAKGDAGVRSVFVSKGRDDADGATYGFRLKVVEMGTDEDSDAITSCTIEELGEAQQSRKNRQRLPAQTSQALEALREAISEQGEPGPRPQISAVRRRTWLDVAIKRMVGPTEAATDKALTRALPILVEAKLVAASRPWIWVVR